MAAHLPPEHPHPQQRVALPSCCMLSPCQADSLCARGGNRQQKLPRRPAGWRKHPAVLMVPWGCSWAQPVSFPNVSAPSTNPSFLMGWCQGMEAGGKKSPSWALCPPRCRGHRAEAGPSSPELSKREAKPARLISPLALRGKLLIGGWVDSQPECYYFPPEGIEPGMFFFSGCLLGFAAMPVLTWPWGLLGGGWGTWSPVLVLRAPCCLSLVFS